MAEKNKKSLCGADLDGANLDGADLDGADLDGANLCRANLRRANLRGANLDGADLRGANLCEITRVIDGGYPDGWKAVAWWTKDNVLVVNVGCRHFTLSAARTYWTGKENRREVMVFLDYAEAVAKIRDAA